VRKGALLSGRDHTPSRMPEIPSNGRAEYNTPMTDHPSRNSEALDTAEKRFHGWRLLGYISCVVVLLALISFLVDWAVIGSLEGRVF